jgi:phospholipid/cholesterol/gamma-HCH transport system substrate-binding protein
MKQRRNRNLIVGLFTTLGLAIFIGAIYLVGRKENIFGSTIEISAVFQNVQGLRVGDRVRLSGIEIGTVNQIGFLSDNRVWVDMALEAGPAGFVKVDSRATVANEGLMGAKVVMILPGTPGAPPVEENDTLATVELVDIDDIMREVKSSSENITRVTSELISITEKINRGEGVFGTIFTDVTITSNLDETADNIARITGNLTEIADRVNRGQGIMGKLFADTILSAGIDRAERDIDDISRNIKEITEKISKGEGIFGRLFTDTSLTSNLFRTSLNLEYTTANLMDLTATLNNDSSALGLLINNPGFADSLQLTLERLNTGIIEATEAAEAVQRSGLIRLFSKDREEEERD